MSIEEYTSEFNNLSIQVGLNKTNEQKTSCYLSGLNKTIRDEMGVVRLFNLQDARQYALMAERKLSRLGGKRAVSSSPDTGWQRDTVVVHGVQSDEEANPSTRIGGRNLGVDKNVKWKKIKQFHSPNSAIVKDSKAGSTSQARYFNCGEAGHKSYACPQRRINLVGDKINFPEPVYDVYSNEEEVIDLSPVEGECLLVFGESKQAESSGILKAVNHEEVGFELLKQHNQPTFEGKVIQEILEGIVGDEMNSFEGDTYEYADFLGVDYFNLQTTKTIIDLVRLLVFGVKSFWAESLAAEDIWYCSRRIKYSKYLFLWSGKVQYQGQSSMDSLSKKRLCLGGFHQTIGIPVRILPNPMG
ncbi:hypothetical protein L3X38_012844 [Prunus dulcis]|uniref:CCHC-type domain-containing protein n=1 Tax=Prunus dulcis TaxID=3755 RepID=A0AAD4WME0_PRUDU|nr:hypothetical protein L3X38_012844 [Prunus dulcis]